MRPLRETFETIQAVIICRVLLVLFKFPFFWKYLRLFKFQFLIILSAGNFKVTGVLRGNFLDWGLVWKL